MSRRMSASNMGQVIEPELPSSGYSYSSQLQQKYTNITQPTSPDTDQVQDLICVGFGPASLAIAIAIADKFPSSSSRPNVSFLERQSQFAWHSGMQLPGAKMQISFLKDLATPRNPKSNFTFINYLYSKGRLNTFINLGTFTPSRREYEDYLRWCAGHFEKMGMVSYGQEAQEVVPDVIGRDGKVSQFKVVSKDIRTGEITTRRARHVVIAVGGRAMLPAEFPQNSPQVVHSSKFSSQVGVALPDANKAYNIAVVGNGQSAAEIFNDLPSRYPNAKVTMIIRGSALRPSDDSPFVNEIFDPERVDSIFQQNSDLRSKAIVLDRATNYGVVRINLLEHLYEKLYMQRLASEDPATWQVNIKNNRKVHKTVTGGKKLRLELQKVQDDGIAGPQRESVDVDAVFVATGYLRNAHEDMLKKTRGLLAPSFQSESSKFPVSRDYKVEFDGTKVAANAGVWLQGCNEATHGLSDTLLSILAIRGGELVQSIFLDEQWAPSQIRAKL